MNGKTKQQEQIENDILLLTVILQNAKNSEIPRKLQLDLQGYSVKLFKDITDYLRELDTAWLDTPYYQEIELHGLMIKAVNEKDGYTIMPARKFIQFGFKRLRELNLNRN